MCEKQEKNVFVTETLYVSKYFFLCIMDGWYPRDC